MFTFMWKLSKTCSKKTATTVSQYMLGINFISTKSVDFAGNVFSWQFSCSICKKSLQERFHYFATVSINIRRSSHFCFEFCWRFSMLLTSNSAGPCFSWVRIWPSSFLKQTFPWILQCYRKNDKQFQNRISDHAFSCITPCERYLFLQV